MMYNRDPVTLFELTDNQLNGNLVPSSLSGDYTSAEDQVTNMEKITPTNAGKNPQKYQAAPDNKVEAL